MDRDRWLQWGCRERLTLSESRIRFNRGCHIWSRGGGFPDANDQGRSAMRSAAAFAISNQTCAEAASPIPIAMSA
jgi:hypothetical protein